ncbi:lipoyl synthase [bacterium]|nr:lipoyl synthase [bacterium]
MQHKPKWIRSTFQTSPRAKEVRNLIREKNLFTVCEESSCPNRGECYNRGTCTFLIMGGICTRGCRFCDVVSGHPLPLDQTEPERIAESVKTLGVRYVVITSVDRDDLGDLGAAHFARTIEITKRVNPEVEVEVLTPDFQARPDCIEMVLDAKPTVFAHNVETVPRLTKTVRDQRASYKQSLETLKIAANYPFSIPVKSGLMVGMGEKDSEVFETIQSLYDVGVRLLTVGQYLAPSKKHLHVQRFVTPAQFNRFKEFALSLGYDFVASAPQVRSSYRAEEFLSAD